MAKRHILGFTLIELLIVFTIIGALSAIVAPNLWKTYQRYSERNQLVSYANEWMALRRDLHFNGTALALSENRLINTTDKELPVTPDGWVIFRNSAIFFLPTGVTNGGEIVLDSPTGRRWQFSIRSLDGRVSIDSL